MHGGWHIDTFMEWWVQQVLRILGFVWDLLDNIKWGNTAVLRVIIMVTIFGALFRVVLTIPQGLTKAITERRPSTSERKKAITERTKE